MSEVKIRQAGKGLRALVIYVPPKMSSWRKEDYDSVLEDKREYLDRIVSKNDRVVLLGDFICKEVESCHEDTNS